MDTGMNRRASYSEEALRIESATAAPDYVARQISTWCAGRPPPVDREAWAGAGIGWD